MNLFLFLVFLTGLTPPGNPVKVPEVIVENNLSFPTQALELDEQKIQLYMVLVDKQQKPVCMESGDNFSFEKEALPFDLSDYWKNRGQEDYHILMSKAVYQVEVEASFFSRSRLSDIGFINRTFSGPEIKKIGENQFQVSGGTFNPDFKYDLFFYQNKDLTGKVRDLVNYTRKKNPELGSPVLTMLQHNYDYGRVMFHKTSKMSVTLSNYYALGSKTVVVSYTLNYIHNLPPSLLGGPEALVGEIRGWIKNCVIKTREEAYLYLASAELERN